MISSIDYLFSGLLLAGLCANSVVSFLFVPLTSNWTTTEMVYLRHGLDDDQSLGVCVARFNSTHQFGCRNAPTSHQYGLPLFVDNSNNLDQLMASSSSIYILIINVYDFKTISQFRVNKDKLVDRLAGVILYRREEDNFPSTSRYQSYSHDSQCPNSNFGYADNSNVTSMWHCKAPWVSQENAFIDFALTSWPFPMFYVQNETLIARLRDCASNKKWQQIGTECVVALQLDMYGSVNSVRCLKRRNSVMEGLMMRYTAYCSTVSVTNLFATLVPVLANQTVPIRSTIVLTVRLDSLTTFGSLAPGANSVYSSLIVLLTIASLLNKQRDQIANVPDKKLSNVLYALFDGESLGYIGSGSSLYYNNFQPVDNSSSANQNMRSHFHLNKTAYVVELNQLLSTGRQNQIWIHSGGQSDELTSRFVEQLEQFESSVKFARASRNDFPPSTVRVFKALDPNISAVLLTAFDSHISDPTYHSLFDQFSMTSHVDIEPTVTRLSDLALTLAKFLYFLITGQTGGQMEPELDLVRNLTQCFFQKVPTCHLFEGRLILQDIPFAFTTPVRSSQVNLMGMMLDKPNTLTLRVGQVRNAILSTLVHATGRILKCNKTDTTLRDYSNIVKVPLDSDHKDAPDKMENKCVFSQCSIESLDSPYFDDLVTGDHEVGKWMDSRRNDFQFSTVTESNFDTNNKQPAIVFFVRPTVLMQTAMLLLGLVLTVLSFAVTMCLVKHSDSLFCCSAPNLKPQRK